MSSMNRLLRSFRDGPALSRRRAMWRMLALFTIVKLTFFAVIFALSWVVFAPVTQGLLSAQDTMTTRTLVGGGLNMLMLLQIFDFSVATVSVGPAGWQETPQVYARLLMNVIATRDMTLTQAVTIAPIANLAIGSETAGATAGEQTIGPLTHPMRALALHDMVYIFAALGGIVFAGMGVFMTVVTLTTPVPTHATPAQAWLEWLSFPFIIILIGSAGVLWALVTRRYSRMEREGIMALVDVDGVTFRSAGRTRYERRMRWGEARAFARVLFADGMGRQHETFVLSGGDEDFLWEALYTGPSASSEEARREEAARVSAHRLVEQVAQRTGLPLLEMSPTIFAALSTSAVGSFSTGWTLFTSAQSIAWAEGDTALAAELYSRIRQNHSALRPMLTLRKRLGGRSPFVRRLTSEQRADILRLARMLLPYYPTPAQMTPNPRSRFLIQAYWTSEFAMELFVIVMAIANTVVFFAFAG